LDRPVPLSGLPLHRPAIIESVEDRAPGDAIARRLRELGFVHGEPVRVVAAGPVGAEPLLVQIGYTRLPCAGPRPRGSWCATRWWSMKAMRPKA
jgi:Fe2+ transport system protein FeoA